ncbi:MAG TPA: hypothetical protein VF808_12495 [Ktedonobacterales bacterium]
MRNIVEHNITADFDPHKVVETVQSKLAPDDWVFATARRWPLFIQASRNGLFALGSGFASLLFLYAFVYTVAHMLDGEPTFIYWMTALFVGFVFGAGFAVAFTIEAWTATWMLIVVPEPWIAVTPNGVVEYRDPKKGIYVAVAFATVVSVASHNQQPARVGWLNPFYQGAGLTISRPHPTNPRRRLARPWMISPGYPLPEQLAQVVVLAQRAYRSRVAARSQWGFKPTIAPVNPRILRVANLTGWSWVLTVTGVVLVLLGLAWIAYVSWTGFSDPQAPWGSFAVVGCAFISGLICCLFAWRINDWKKDL